MVIDNNLIAYEYFKNQFVPNEVYTSGKKEETQLNNKYKMPSLNAPVLSIHDDIVNKDGYGLKRGFYSVCPDKYLDFLYIYQSGKLKAKVPVINVEVYESINPVQPKVKKMSRAKYYREQQKEYRKYMNGENPEKVDWSEVEIYKMEDKNSYLIIYNSNNIQLTGLIKF